MTALARGAALAAIGAYQRWLSPHKGFCCAYRAHTGRASCSALGARVIRRFGLRHGLRLLRQRLRRCGDAHARMRGVARAAPLLQRPQRGVCDPGCDAPCDPAGVDCGGTPDVCGGRAGRGLECLDCCSCDWPGRRRRDAGDRHVRRPAGRWPD